MDRVNTVSKKPMFLYCNICPRILRDRWYRCLLCHNFSICIKCYDDKKNWGAHFSRHAIQPVLSKETRELFNQGGDSQSDLNLWGSYTCPYCGEKGFTTTTIQDHLAGTHAGSEDSVSCPICMSLPSQVNSYYMRNLQEHLIKIHKLESTTASGGPETSGSSS